MAKIIPKEGPRMNPWVTEEMESAFKALSEHIANCEVPPKMCETCRKVFVDGDDKPFVLTLKLFLERNGK